MKFRSIAACFLLVAGCSRQVPTQKTDTGKNPDAQDRIMFVQGGKGHTLLSIPNASNTQTALSLTYGAVTDATTGAEIVGATLSFKDESGGQPAGSEGTQSPKGSPAPSSTNPNQGQKSGVEQKTAPSPTVLPGSAKNVQVNVANLTATAWAKVSIFNQGTNIGKLSLVVLDDPLNVVIDGLGTSVSTAIPSTYGDPITITLKNNSAEFLALDCSVELAKSSSPCDNNGKIVLPPNASKAIPVDLDWSAYSWSELVQPSAEIGMVKLTTQVPEGASPQIVPIKLLPLNLTMAATGPIPINLLSLIYVGLFLALGGYFSILANNVLPNMVRKAEFRKQVKDLANRTSSVSTKVDSYLRVLLRLERKKIQALLDNLSGLSPSAADQFTEVSNQMTDLQKRLAVAERLDKLRRSFEDRSATAPPSISDGIDKNLSTAAVQLHSFVLNDADIQAANGYLDKAEGLLKLLDDDDSQARQIAQNYIQLRSRLQAFPKDYYADLKKALSGIFDSLHFGDASDHAAEPPANVPVNNGNPSGAGSAGGAGLPGNIVAADNDGQTNTSDATGAPVQGISTLQNDSLDHPAPPDPGVSARTGVNNAPGNPAGQVQSAPKQTTGSPNDFSDPKNILAPMFFAVDHGIAAIQTILDYAIVRASVATGTSKDCSDPGQDAMKRLKDHECQLLNLLGTLSWKSLRGAINLVQQMRENVYEVDVYQHIKEKKAKIVFDTQRARPFLPVFFSIAFDDPRLNGAAALDEVTFNWTFPSELYESGWKICHYFDGKEGAAVATEHAQTDPRQTIRIVSIKIEAKNSFWQDSQKLEDNIKMQSENPKVDRPGVLADRLRFGIAFVVTLAGLKSGALDQLAKLGFVQATVAIIALGFGADTVKNVLTQSSKPQAGAAPPVPPISKTGH